jgi:hypothetical protein
MKIRRKVFKSKEHNECTKELKKERMLWNIYIAYYIIASDIPQPARLPYQVSLKWFHLMERQHIYTRDNHNWLLTRLMYGKKNQAYGKTWELSTWTALPFH